MPKEIILPPIKESTEDYEKIEAMITKIFRDKLYKPLLKSLSLSTKSLTNALEDLAWAIQKGRISFKSGTFSGSFNSTLTKELKKLGATFDRRTGTFKIRASELPITIRQAVSASEAKWKDTLAKIDRNLEKILPEDIAEAVKAEPMFDSALWKVEDDFQASVSKITIAPKLTDRQAEKLSREWNNNLKLYVKDFAAKEIVKLRKDVQASVFAGNRRDSIAKKIQASYGVTENKAKFLARQETGLLMAKFKETRYQGAGVEEYIWTCVSGSKNHPVRPAHKALDGKKFRFDNPPITDEKGQRNNPGQDYNCRCFARPVVRF